MVLGFSVWGFRVLGFIKCVRQVNTNMTKTRLYSTQARKNSVRFVSCSHVQSNFASPNQIYEWLTPNMRL